MPVRGCGGEEGSGVAKGAVVSRHWVVKGRGESRSLKKEHVEGKEFGFHFSRE